MININTNIHVIIPAGGSGIRFGGNTKKQFLELGGKSILEQTLNKFINCPQVTQIILALPQDELDGNKFSDAKVCVVEGGATRAHSVKNAFAALQATDEDVVLIHDAVRPLLTQELILKIAQATLEKKVVVPAVNISDTVKQVDEKGEIIKTLDRDYLYGAQTPQGMMYRVLKSAYEKVDLDTGNFTDEAMMCEAAGEKVFIVEGERHNIKITTPFDLDVAKLLMKNLVG
jgi:2-C-methyl-D-erythritol 4-phosphate cytidylyltransferase